MINEKTEKTTEVAVAEESATIYLTVDNLSGEILSIKPDPTPVGLDFLVSGETLINMGITKMPSLVDPILPKVGVVSLAGSSDTGKSSFLRQLGCAIATGKSDFLGFPLCCKHGRVIYVSTEDDKIAMATLMQKQNADKLPATAYKNINYIFDPENLVQKLELALSHAPVDCVIIDTFTDIYGGDMNVTNKVRNFLTDYSVLANRHSCLFIFLHHTGKKTEDLAPSKNNLLGSQGFEAKMRLVIELRQDKAIPEHRHMCIVKGNYLPTEYKQDSYKLYFDEHMLFTNTGDRVPFEHLVGCIREDFHEKTEYLLALGFRKEGFSYRKISEKLLTLGYHIGKTTIQKWLKHIPVISTATEDIEGDAEIEE